MSKDPFRYFRIEARELVATLEKGVVELGSSEPRDPEKLRALLRASHTLKGAAGVVRHAAIARLAHELETQLAAHAPVDRVLAIVDACSRELTEIASPAGAVAAPAESVRLDLEEVDALLAALVDLGARISTARAKSGAEREALLEGIERLARDTLEDARRIRLLRVDTLFAELTRAVHDAAALEGRTVQLATTGGEHRLDAHVLALVRDALVQLVRNAIAHGIEAPADRSRAGKPVTGTITIGVDVHGARATIFCRDDGRGLDVEALRESIVARNVTSREAASRLDATGLVRVAMRAGVSTRTTASELAGRGVGLGVVAAALDRVRGSIVVRSAPGAGTEIALEVPVTMTAAPALTVAAAEQVVTIRLDAVRRTTRLAAGAVVRAAAGDVLVDGDEHVPFAALGRVLGTKATAAESAVLLDVGGARAALGVDRILGVGNEVVLPVPAAAKTASLVAGASLDGEGTPRLALDPRLLVDAIAALHAAPEPAPAPDRPPARVLVCDDSLTSRLLEQSILEAAGYDVTTATSGEEALEKARAGGFALFVIDVEMPGMSGFETVARLRADPALAGVPAVLVTSRGAPEDRRRGLEAGARAYIVKGEFAQAEFLDTVRRLIG